jgi:excinuclease UvrABC helicase subunit UvrB
MFDFVRRRAEREDDRHHLEKWRPYILRMNGIARAMLAAEKEKVDEALQLLEECVESIQSLEPLDDETFQFERERSLGALGELVKQLRKARPLSEVERLESELQDAIKTQEFERAAQLRDRLREIRAGG